MSEPLSRLLSTHPLPGVDGDKSDRGTALVVAGTPACPGAAILAGTAALRAGAGRVQILTHPSVVTAVAVAVPEALVVGVRGARPTGDTVRLLREADAVLVGPGLGAEARDVAVAVGARLDGSTPLLLDAGAVRAAPDLTERRLVLLPNVDEAADLVDADGEGDVDPETVADHLARRLGALVAVRGATTFLTDGEATWSHPGHPGLGTAGSGDALAGIAVGLCARGIDPLAAIGWSVGIHATAGELAAEGTPGYGYLAREVVAAVPGAISALSTRCASTSGSDASSSDRP